MESTGDIAMQDFPVRRRGSGVRSSGPLVPSTERAPEPNPDQNDAEVIQPWYRRFWNYQPHPEAGWVQVVEQTGVPGVVEIARPNRHVTVRLYWVIVCIMVGLHAGVIVGWAMGKSEEHPVVITTRTEEIFTAVIPSPATDLVLLKGFRKTQMDEYRRIEEFTQYYIDPKQQQRFKEWKFNNPWTVEQFHALSYCVGETCESKTSASSRLGISNMEKEMGKKKYTQMKSAQKTPLYDDPRENFFEKIIPFLQKSITNCNELVVGCIWSGKKTNCTQFFISSYSNFGGGTCSHNKMSEWILRTKETLQSRMEVTMDDTWNERVRWEEFSMDKYFFAVLSENGGEWNQEVPLRQAVAGPSTGLTLIVASNPNDFVCPQQDSDGVKIGVHSIISEPNVGKSRLVATWNHETFVAVIPAVTLADKNLKDIPLKQRGCAFDGDIKLKYYNHYTRDNCIQERLSDAIYAKCNCTLISAPKEYGSPICNLEQLICANDVEVEVFSKKSKKVYIDCLPRCIDVKYNTKLTSTPYSNGTAEEFQKYFNLPNGTLTAVIHVFMEDDSVMVKIRSVKYDTWDKVGLFAGIFGFTTGTSFMTVAYLLAAFILMLYLIIKWLYKRHQLGLFPFKPRNSDAAINPPNSNPTDADGGTVDPNAVEPFSIVDQDGNDDSPIFTIRRVPGPEPIDNGIELDDIV